MTSFLKYAFVFVLLIGSCGPTTEKEYVNNESPTLFRDISATESGLSFNNSIVETAQVNYYKYVYLYNGGGVGIGDINNDGLPDVYMTATQQTDKIFLNKGNLQFEDISVSAGINSYDGQKTGVTMVDINNDGWLDIYVCRAGWHSDSQLRRNLLFINQKNTQFKEMAASYGLDDIGHSTQASFFDYDNDGDLDMYLANHPGEFSQPLSGMTKKIQQPNASMSDKLYQNNGNNTFTDASLSAGINNYGYGLGIVTADFNNDGWTDVYVTNDFAPHDYFYLNNSDGTFTESIKEYFPHCSYFSMGVDMVDLNNDTHLDLLTVEMLAEDNVRQKTNMAPMDMGRFSYMVNNGMHYQFMRNSMHINNGNGYFSDIAYYSGIDKTDWSWGTLFGDYDNDGDNDLITVNGFLKDTQDKDFSKRSNALAKKNNNKLTFEQAHALLKSTPVENYAYEYEGNYKFKKSSDEWGFNFKGFSNGVAYGDLDRDGDLDVIVNNINANASLYENTKNSNDFIGFTFSGSPQNKSALQSKLTLYTSQGKQYKEFQVTRGFQSSCDHITHFGLAPNDQPQSLDIEWPDGKQQLVNNLKKGTYINLDYKNASKAIAKNKIAPKDKPLQDVSQSSGFQFTHKDIYHDDYKKEVLLPHLLSQMGPALCSADVDGNGLDDFYIGGAHQQTAALWLQKKAGTFIKSSNNTWATDAAYEDIDALFFDADGDGDKDLYVVSGSNEFEDKNMYQDRLYRNNGKGVFIKTQNTLPKLTASGGCVSNYDFDQDGDEDLFVGGRLVPGEYPLPATSYLLENQKGIFKDVTAQKAPDLQTPGMIASSVWSDFDKDGLKDLIIVGEWTDILFYKNNNGQLEKVSSQMGLNKHVGWWNSIKATDLDGDGDDDYVLGNLGLNYKYKATDEKPFEVFSADMDNNGKRDIVVGYYSGEKLFPVRGLQCSSEQMPEITEKFPTYEAFGKADVFEVYGDALEDALHYQANDFSSIILWNNEGSFEAEQLPSLVQWAPVQDFIITDINQDQLPDIIAAGNWFVSEIETPRADSGTGVVMINKGKGKFEALSTVDSGLFANKDVRALSLLSCGENNKPLLLIANNNSSLQAFQLNTAAIIQ